MIVQIRRVDTPDKTFLKRMTYEACYWDSTSARPSPEEALKDPALRQYFEGWGRDGDVAVVASDPYSGQPVGMAWARRYPSENPSFGFVSPDVPELSIAVIEGARRQHVGTQLLEFLGNELRKDGVESFSLAVEPKNPAINLYRQLGFKTTKTQDGAEIMTRNTQSSGCSL